MNIFVTHSNPVISAQNLDDKRVIKMCVETAQMLCSVFHELSDKKPPYKNSHRNHPCSIWARTSRENFEWLCNHGIALCKEYTKRYHKIHKSEKVISWCFINYFDIKFPETGLTRFANCAANKSLGIDYKDLKDVPKAYQLYLNDRWEHDARQPTWYGIGR